MASSADDSGPIYLFQDTHPEWGFMSNWYSSPFHTGDKVIVFQTVEHHMMYHKAKLFSDHEIASEIISSPPLHPSKVQELGRKVKNYNKAVWEEHRERIVEEGSYHKYVHSLRDDQDLKAMLLQTGDRELVEASPVDRIWGIGFPDTEAPHNRERWGMNLMGKALARARKRIQEEQGAKA